MKIDGMFNILRVLCDLTVVYIYLFISKCIHVNRSTCKMYSQLGETELNIADMDDLFEIKALKKTCFLS